MTRKRRIELFSRLIVVLVLAACQPGEPRPADIAPGDMCAQCRMAISEKRFAAQLVDQDGDAVKFDDITCMVRYVGSKRNTDTSLAFFVVDADSRQWLRAETAQYVQSAEFKTPMRGGIVAYRDEAKADAAAAQYHGKRLRFTDLLGG